MNKQTLTRLKQYKTDGKIFATLTAYDATLARIAEASGVEVLLIGDSLGNVIQGQGSTVPVNMEQMCYHTGALNVGPRTASLWLICLLCLMHPPIRRLRTRQLLCNQVRTWSR